MALIEQQKLKPTDGTYRGQMALTLSQGRVRVGLVDERVFIQVTGRATYLNGPSLRDFAKEMIHDGFHQFELDLGDCDDMDSTFLGILVGISTLLTSSGSRRVSVARIHPRAYEVLRTLGIERYFRFDPSCSVATELTGDAMRSLPASGSKSEVAGAIIEAHEALAEADPRNEPRFEEVLQSLREDLGRSRQRYPTSAALFLGSIT